MVNTASGEINAFNDEQVKEAKDAGLPLVRISDYEKSALDQVDPEERTAMLCWIRTKRTNKEKMPRSRAFIEGFEAGRAFQLHGNQIFEAPKIDD